MYFISCISLRCLEPSQIVMIDITDLSDSEDNEEEDEDEDEENVTTKKSNFHLHRKIKPCRTLFHVLNNFVLTREDNSKKM